MLEVPEPQGEQQREQARAAVLEGQAPRQGEGLQGVAQEGGERRSQPHHAAAGAAGRERELQRGAGDHDREVAKAQGVQGIQGEEVKAQEAGERRGGEGGGRRGLHLLPAQKGEEMISIEPLFAGSERFAIGSGAVVPHYYPSIKLT